MLRRFCYLPSGCEALHTNTQELYYSILIIITFKTFKYYQCTVKLQLLNSHM